MTDENEYDRVELWVKSMEFSMRNFAHAIEQGYPEERIWNLSLGMTTCLGNFRQEMIDQAKTVFKSAEEDELQSKEDE